LQQQQRLQGIINDKLALGYGATQLAGSFNKMDKLQQSMEGPVVAQAQLQGSKSPGQRSSKPQNISQGTTVTRSLADHGFEKDPGFYSHPFVVMEDVIKNSRKPVSAGILVNERVSLANPTDKINYKVPKLEPQRTLPGGILPDKFSAPFMSPKGQITFVQTLYSESGLRTTPWSLTLHANGAYEVDTNSTTFH
jgi:hypothetical protein